MKRVGLATITATLAGLFLGATIFIITVELDDGKRWDLAL